MRRVWPLRTDPSKTRTVATTPRYSSKYDDPANKTSGEFDVVTQDPEGYAFYEAKFRKSPITQMMVDKEIAQVEATGLKCHRYGFFSRSGFEASSDNKTILIDLPQMFD